jgi:hypothetical protein
MSGTEPAIPPCTVILLVRKFLEIEPLISRLTTIREERRSALRLLGHISVHSRQKIDGTETVGKHCVVGLREPFGVQVKNNLG